MMQNWLKEPLLHFLVGGALLFVFFAWQGEPVDPASREISIGPQELSAIASGFEQQMGRAPTDSELDRLTERFVREEVLYREALRLGLDQDDAIIRRRLAQKMDLIASAQAEAAIPSEKELEAWLQAHPTRFSKDPKFTFEQVWFAEHKQGLKGHKALQEWARPLKQAAKIDLPGQVYDMPRGEVLDRFGQQFVRELESLEPGDQWQGPIPSGLGWHAVLLRKTEAQELPALETVRDKVEADWRLATAAKREEQAYQMLRDAYSVEIKQ